MREMHKYLVPTIFSNELFCVFVLLQIDALMPLEDAQQEVLIGLVLLLLGYTVLVKNKFSFEDAGFMVITAIYIGLGFHYFIETQRIGLEYIFFAIIVILATDTGAYFSGRYFGKRKLW